MPKLIKKFVFSFLSFLILFVSVGNYFAVAAATNTTPSSANSSTAAPWYDQGFGDWFLKVYDQSNPSEIFGERYTAAQVQWVIYGLWAFIINFIMGPRAGAVAACVLSAPSQEQTLGTCLEPAISGLLGISYLQTNDKASLLSRVFADRPFSGIAYIRDKIDNFSFIPVAHAQTVGFGFSALQTIQQMWTAFRDIAYGLFVITAVVFAFMIMFRVKINPQTVITVQSAIPKVIFALIVVTFSYAIAGLLVDLMYVVIGLISLVMAPLIPHVTLFQTQTFNASAVFQLLTVGPISNSPGTNVASAGGIIGLMGLYLGPLLFILFVATMVLGAGSIALAATGPGILLAIITAIAFILFIIVIIILLWMAVKVIWTLFKAFANVVLLTVFAPIQLSLGVLIPNFSFGQWVKNYLSHLSVFVVTGVLALFSWIFSLMAWKYIAPGATGPNLTIAISSTGTANPWPPLLGNLIGAGDFGTAVVMAGVAFVFFTLIPKSAELVQAFLSGKPFAYGTAIGEAFSPITGLGKTPVARTLSEYAALGTASQIMQSQLMDRFINALPQRLRGSLERTQSAIINKTGSQPERGRS